MDAAKVSQSNSAARYRFCKDFRRSRETPADVPFKLFKEAVLVHSKGMLFLLPRPSYEPLVEKDTLQNQMPLTVFSVVNLDKKFR
jgi:hypothetical protein